MEEIWKDIPRYEGLYQASTEGRIKSLPKMINGCLRGGQMLKPIKNGTSLSVVLCHNNSRKTFPIHILVAKTFIPNLQGFTFVRHIDKNMENNRVNNLEWSLKSGNILTKRETYEKRKSPIYGVGINDIPEYLRGTKVYLVWKSILARCYSVKFQNDNPTYKGCYICDEWKRLSAFKDWFDKNYVEGYQLDKDILGSNERCYSPRTCCFIPQELNNLIKNSKESEQGYPRGVRKQYRLYIALFRHNGMRLRKTFRNVKDAAIWYAKTRAEYIIELAKNYARQNLIKEDILEAIRMYVSNEILKAQSINV